MSPAPPAEERDTVVPVAEWAADRAPGVLVAYGLGSCVALMLHDPVTRVGAMAHLLLPSASLSRDHTHPAKFPETAVPLLLHELADMGAERARIVAKLAGGASMFVQLMAPGTVQMGERNVVAAREALRAHVVPIVAEAVGGTKGRSVWFRVADGGVIVRSVGEPERVF